MENFMGTDLILSKDTSKFYKVSENTNSFHHEILEQLGLPTEGVLSDFNERKLALLNLSAVLSKVDNLEDSWYLSRFFVAVSTGLFDAALNYLWDETIKQLRLRILMSDINYFYDLTLSDNKRIFFSTENDLTNIDDATLVSGCLKIGIISDIGYRHLDYIRDMRNHSSAAHPSKNELTGLSLINWLDICIKEVIDAPISENQIKINQLLGNIKKSAISNTESETISKFFPDLSSDKCNDLAKGFFGIYIDKNTLPETIANINFLAPLLWDFVREETRSEFGIRHANFVVNGENEKKNAARQFLENVEGLSYLTDAVKTPEINDVLERLIDSHNACDNFYTEPSISRELANLIGKHGSVPDTLNFRYVQVLITVFLSNGHGVAWNAEGTYIELIKKFSNRQAYLAITSFRDHTIKSKLQFPICQTKYATMLNLCRMNISSDGVKELLDEILSEIKYLHSVASNNRLFSKINNFDKALGLF